ncbi:InlB B-repeat-containing protein [Peptoniphilus sp. MSJ-1]|uniref:InlB B-repeat-containing protein n=1 Tax=Peptoniphilus ovalis TaxID=2841503 RepID=A0ABS6FF31_9FIRM|nr:InlB B-repeat-containing protein [Peptoniphilus ovalis]MBU5668782.1 InlB B-repeat-containing protein [Peptoniphilus ovalis]
MRKRFTAFGLAFITLSQVFVPTTAIANNNELEKGLNHNDLREYESNYIDKTEGNLYSGGINYNKSKNLLNNLDIDNIVENEVINDNNILNIYFDANGGYFSSLNKKDKQILTKQIKSGDSLTELVEEPINENKTFIGWGIKGEAYNNLVPINHNHLNNVTDSNTFYAIWIDDVIQQNGIEKPTHVPKNYVKVYFDMTDKVLGKREEKNKTFWVNPEKEVSFEVRQPSGKGIKVKGQQLEWRFIEWINHNSVEDFKIKYGIYNKNLDGQIGTISGKFTKDTIFEAKYSIISEQILIPIILKQPYVVPVGTQLYVHNMVKNKYGSNGYDYIFPKETEFYGFENEYEARPFIISNEPKTINMKVSAQYKTIYNRPHKIQSINAQLIYVDHVVPQTDSNKPLVPDNYVQVTFEPTEKGTLDANRIYWVNPKEKVNITIPNPRANENYKFIGWNINNAEETFDTSKPYKFENNTTIIASYELTKNIISFDPKEQIKTPEGYVKILFEAEKGLKLLENKAYFVMKNNGIKLDNADIVKPRVDAETGYKFISWDKDDDFEIKNVDVIVKAKSEELKDLIPKSDGVKKPEGYVSVRFEVEGDGGKINEGEVVEYYVNPNKSVAIKQPNTSNEIGYKPVNWSRDTSQATNYTDEETIIKGTFEKLEDIIPLKDSNGKMNIKPNGYITVTFSAVDHGTLEGDKVFYINPKNEIILKDYAPQLSPNTGYEFIGWDREISKPIKFNDGDVISAKYNELADILTEAKPGYVKVEFISDGNGSFEGGHKVYFVNSTKEVDLSKFANEIVKKANIGYEVRDWDKEITKKKYKENTVYTYKFSPLADVLTEAKPGYVKVEFISDENGSFEGGNKVYFVNPTKEVDLAKLANEIVKKPNIGYEGGNWDKEITKKKYKEDTVYTYKFTPLADILTEAKPGYVKVEFISDENGSFEGGNKVYFVNPNKKIKANSGEFKIPRPIANKNYEFDRWSEELSEEIKSDKIFKAIFKPIKVSMTYEANDKTSGVVPEANFYNIGTKVKISEINNLSRENHAFKAWQIDGKEYAPGEEFEITKDTIAKAIWKVNSYKVIFETQGGEKIHPIVVNHDEKIGEIKIPNREGFKFTGWVLDGKNFDTNKDKVTKNITLVAQYIPIKKEETKENNKFIEEKETINKIQNNWDDYLVNNSNSSEKITKVYTNNEVKVSTEINQKSSKPTYKIEKNFMQGYSDEFRPKDRLTRAEAAQILANVLINDGFKLKEDFKISYSDVGDEWYTEAIKIVTEAKIFNGYEDGSFKPQNKITRAEWIVTLKRFKNISDKVGNEMKLKEGHWATKDIEAASNSGWLNIYKEGKVKFNPDEFITREEVAAVSNRAFDRVVDKKYIRENVKNLISYKDIDDNMWSYYDIICASNTFTVSEDSYISK